MNIYYGQSDAVVFLNELYNELNNFMMYQANQFEFIYNV